MNIKLAMGRRDILGLAFPAWLMLFAFRALFHWFCVLMLHLVLDEDVKRLVALVQQP